MKKWPELSRQAYELMLKDGWKFRNACLYEPDHAPKHTRFYHVRLGPKQTVFKRLLGKEE